MLANYTHIFQLIVLAVVQGITELLPISSTAHLIITNKILGTNFVDNFNLTTLHIGTTLAIIFANKDFLFKNMFSKEKISLYFKIVLGSIPAIVGALLFGDFIDAKLHVLWVIAVSLIVVGALMIVAEKYLASGKETSFEDINLKQVGFAGAGEALALLPGVSRSGITTIFGMFAGLNKMSAIRFSFLLGLPVLVGSFFYEFIKTENAISIVLHPETIMMIVITAVIGYFSLRFLESMAKKRFLTFFGIYRILLGIVILLFLFR